MQPTQARIGGSKSIIMCQDMVMMFACLPLNTEAVVWVYA
jgi:hypothetical protein